MIGFIRTPAHWTVLFETQWGRTITTAMYRRMRHVEHGVDTPKPSCDFWRDGEQQLFGRRKPRLPHAKNGTGYLQSRSRKLNSQAGGVGTQELARQRCKQECFW